MHSVHKNRGKTLAGKEIRLEKPSFLKFSDGARSTNIKYLPDELDPIPSPKKAKARQRYQVHRAPLIRTRGEREQVFCRWVTDAPPFFLLINTTHKASAIPMYPVQYKIPECTKNRGNKH